MRFEAERARANAVAIAFPRRSGSEGSARARGHIVAQLRAANLEPAIESFGFSPLLMELALPLAVLAVAGVVLAATFTYPSSPGAAMALLLLGFLAGLPATRWNRGIERLLDRGAQHEGINVVVEVPAPADADRHLILMAHYDSKSQRLPIMARMAAAFAVLGGGVFLCISAILGTLARGHVIPPAGVLVAGSLSAIGLLALGANRSGNASPGALDNATGVGILLEVARQLSETPLSRTRVTLLFTDAEEEGLAGAARFLQSHGDALAPAPLVVNLDTLGAGGAIGVLSHFGIPPVGTGARLAQVVLEVAAEERLDVRSVYLPAGAATDHYPAAYRGIPALTLLSVGRGLRRVHTPADIPSRVAWEGVDAAGRLLVGLVHRVDHLEQPLS